MNKIDDNLHKVIARLHSAAQVAGRQAGEVALIAVSKTQAPSALIQAYNAGQRRFGENYVQEALEKRAALSHLADVEWHFIGAIQSNKTRAIAENFDWVHTTDRAQIAGRLRGQRSADLPPLNVCLPGTLDEEDRRAGVSPGAAQHRALAVGRWPGPRLRGLMALPAPRAHPRGQRQAFARLPRA